MSSIKEGAAAAQGKSSNSNSIGIGRTSPFGRSVLDYVTTRELDQALQGHQRTQSSSSSSKMEEIAAKANKEKEPEEKETNGDDDDWRLPIPDHPNNTEQQTADTEVQRLLTLKSYMVLDAEKEDAFDQLTREAREVFGVPTSLISLIDLGRQFLFSNTGADVRETTREVAFCAYTIQSKHDTTVVPDAAQDFRFKDGPLVQRGPKLRFYAGAPLISPEGYKLGTFCVEGPIARPNGLSDDEKRLLREYAAKTMELLVERRKRLRDVLANKAVSFELRQHAAVATSLGDYMYEQVGDLDTAMRLYQESVQTIMHADHDSTNSVGRTTTDSPAEKRAKTATAATAPPPPPPLERQKAMVQLLTLLSMCGPSTATTMSETTKKDLEAKVVALYEPVESTSTTTSTASSIITDHGIAGLFHVPPKLKGLVSDPQPLPVLFFHEVFKIDMSGCLMEGGGGVRAVLQKLATSETTNALDDLKAAITPFTVPLDECSKATLFNMGLIHYHWHHPETAMQFFHLAASVSHKISPLEFDPIDISCINNMAQIHLQYGQSDDAMKMLTETLERGNRALAAMYRQTETEQSELLATTTTVTTSGTATTTTTTSTTPEDDNDSNIHGDDGGDDEYDYERLDEISDESEQRDMFRTVRLRRKLARTLINIAHVHYFNRNYNAAMASLKGAIPLVDAKVMTGRTLAAIWYNMSLVFYHKGGGEQGMLQEALVYLDKFLELATKVNGHDHLQNSNALYRKARILFEMGNANAAMEPIEEALRIRKLKLDKNHSRISEALCLKGKILLSRNECDAALDSLNTCFEMQRKQQQQQQLNSAGAGGDDQHLTFEMAQTLLDIGQALHIQGHVDASIEKYLVVLEWTRKFFGPQHAFVARVDGIIGNIYGEAGKMQEAKPFLDEAAAIQQGMPQKTV